MSTRDRFAPEDREDDIEIYDAAPADMPPSPAGADVEIGGEAAASRRLAGLPPHLAEKPQHHPGEEPDTQPEPFLGYDGLPLDDILDWIDQEDPGPDLLQKIVGYETLNRNREIILDDCQQRLQRWEDSN
jgi:hypothetical protein